jgi:hypothetical protein
MARNVADGLWEMLVAAGVRRCYGIVGDALNPVIDALRRNGSVDFVHVRNEEYGAFAAVAEALLTGNPVAVCGTAGPGVVHLVNGPIDARRSSPSPATSSRRCSTPRRLRSSTRTSSSTRPRSTSVAWSTPGSCARWSAPPSPPPWPSAARS